MSQDKTHNACNGRLLYPQFAIAFIQTFTLDKYLKLRVPQTVFKSEEGSNHAIEVPKENIWAGKDFAPEYELDGFDFQLQLFDWIIDGMIETKGHCSVKVNIFFNRTVSITYRFNFDQEVCSSNHPFSTDCIINFISQYLIEPQNYFHIPDSECERCKLVVSSFPFDEEGNSFEGGLTDNLSGDQGLFREFFLRYKKHLLKQTSFRRGTPKWYRDGFKHLDYNKISDINDIHYALVDIRENLEHPTSDGKDLFSWSNEAHFTELDIIRHIKEHHKKEMIGLMSLCPEEWPYRDEDAFSNICGEDISLDSDDMVLVGDRVSVVLGTYARRAWNDDSEDSIEWNSLLKEERASYGGLSWPEILLLLQFRLAQKSVLQNASRVLLSTISNEGNVSKIINRNQEDNYILAKSMLQYDAVDEISSSFRIMSESIARRLDVDSDRKKFEHNMETISKALTNIKEGQSSRREITMNIILGIVSVISAFQLFFVGTRMPFLSDYWHVESGTLGALIITGVATISIVIVLIALFVSIKSLILRRK